MASGLPPTPYFFPLFLLYTSSFMDNYHMKLHKDLMYPLFNNCNVNVMMSGNSAAAFIYLI